MGRQLQNIIAASLCLQDGALVAGKMRITDENNNLAPNKGLTPNSLLSKKVGRYLKYFFCKVSHTINKI